MAKITAAQVRDALLVLKRDGGDPWPLVESFMLSFAKRVDDLEVALKYVVGECKKAGVIVPKNGAQQAAQDEAPAAPSPRMGADGTPITDMAQLQAEEMMDAAAGPRGSDPMPAPEPAAAPPPESPRVRMPPRGGMRVTPQGAPVNGGVRLGADGQPITDPQQLAAEELMDAAIADMPPQR
jgi:hypothetical protein